MFPSVVAIVILSALTYALFYVVQPSVPLSAAAMVVVIAFWTLIVLAGRAMVAAWRKKR
jgi:hypothetical protein